MWIGRMAISWCRGSAGVVLKAPIIHLTTLSWTPYRIFNSCFCCLNQIGELYVKTERQIALSQYVRCQLPWLSPFTELLSSFMDLRVPHALVAIILTYLCQLSLWLMNRPRYWMLSVQLIVVIVDCLCLLEQWWCWVMGCGCLGGLMWGCGRLPLPFVNITVISTGHECLLWVVSNKDWRSDDICTRCHCQSSSESLFHHIEWSGLVQFPCICVKRSQRHGSKWLH